KAAFRGFSPRERVMSENDGELLRLLRGELASERAAALRARLATDAELRARYAELEGAWRSLGPDPAVEPRLGFATAVMARARAEAGRAPGRGWAAGAGGGGRRCRAGARRRRRPRLEPHPARPAPARRRADRDRGDGGRGRAEPGEHARRGLRRRAAVGEQ